MNAAEFLAGTVDLGGYPAPRWSVGLTLAGAVLGCAPVVYYYLHAVTGLGGAAFALFMVRRRFLFLLAALVAIGLSGTGAHPVAFGVEFWFEPQALVAFAFVVVGSIVFEWRAISSRFVSDTDAAPSSALPPDRAPVLLVPGGGGPRAYLLDWVSRRHVVDDTAGGLLVTYCPLARSASVFRRPAVEGMHSALPWAGHYLLAGPRGAAWSQVTGEVVVGAGEALVPVPFRLCTWADAKRAGAMEVVGGPQAASSSSVSEACVVAPAGMPVDEPLRAVVPACGVAVGWSDVLASASGVTVRAGARDVTVRRDPGDGAAVADSRGSEGDPRPEAVVLVRASVVDRLVASGRSNLRLA